MFEKVVVIGFLLGMSICDYRKQLIPVVPCVLLFFIGAILQFYGGTFSKGSCVVFLICFLLFVVSKYTHESIGYGDLLCICVLNMWMNCGTLVMGMFFSMVMFSVVGIVLILIKKVGKTDRMVFIPYLFCGIAISLMVEV